MDNIGKIYKRSGDEITVQIGILQNENSKNHTKMNILLKHEG